MRITDDMIDKELRGAAFFGRLMMQPWPWYFRFIAGASRKQQGKTVEGIRCEEALLPRRSDPRSSIRTCIYKPLYVGKEPLPVLLYLHGGGYFMGVPETFGPVIKQFIDTRPCIVVSPDYRKSIEAPYPAALDDCYDTLLWIKNNSAALGARADQIMVGGHSAGGGLTAAVSLRARDRGDVKIAYQMPIYPMIDDRMQTESAKDNNTPFWSSKHNALGWSLYLDGLKDGEIPAEAAPARATDYAGLPPTMTYVGDLEPFRDETIAYVENLKAVGVPVEFEMFKGCFHGFDVVAQKANVAKRATAFMLECFARAVDTRFAAQS